MMGIRKKYTYQLLSLIILVVVASSCRTAREMPAERVRPVSAEKLFRQVEQHAFDFNDLTVRRINVQYADDESRTSFRASLRATKDEKILASFSKLNIPVGRVLLTPGNVTYVNFIDRSYFEGDYSYLSDMLNFNISFDMVQAIISNPVKNRNLPESILRQYETKVENGKYVLHYTGRANIYRPERSRYTIRNDRNYNSAGHDNMVLRKIVVDPRTYVLERIEMDDVSSDRKLEVQFSDFVKVDNYDYPGEIDIRMMNDDEVTSLNIKMRGFSTEKVDSLELAIPDRYQRIRGKR